MSTIGGPNIVEDGLVLSLDAANTKSYPGSGTVWTDLSGNGNNGTLINGPTFDSGSNGSILFDGVNDFVDTTFTDNIVSTGFTFNFWFYGTKSTVHFPVQFFINADANMVFRVERFSAGNDTIEFGHTPSGASVDDGNELISFNFPNNIWTCCTVVYDGDVKYIYKNGILDVSSSSGQSLTYYSGAFLRIGARQNGSLLPFGGNIPAVLLYNRALTAQEILQNYNATKGRFGL